MLSAKFPERRRLLSGRRHRQPGAEFRSAGGDRRADQRQRSALRLRHRAARSRTKMALIPGVTDLRIAEPLDYPTLQGQRRSRQGARARHHRAAGRVEPARRRCRGTTLSAAELLARSGKRRQLQRRRAGAAASDRLGRRAVEHSAQHSASSAGTAVDATVTPPRRRSRNFSATSRSISHDLRPRGRRALHRAARDRRGLRRQRTRPRQRRPPRCSSAIDQPRQTAGRHPGRHSRSEPGDARIVQHAGRGPDSRDRPRLSADGREFSVVARAVHHHDGGAGRAGRRAVDAGADRHDDQRRVADGRDHGGRRRRRQRQPAHHFRQRDARGRL